MHTWSSVRIRACSNFAPPCIQSSRNSFLSMLLTLLQNMSYVSFKTAPDATIHFSLLNKRSVY